MRIEIHHYHHIGDDNTSEITRLLRALYMQGERIMKTQAEVAAELATVKDQLTKISTEQSAQSQALQTKIAELTQAVANAGNATPEVEAALAAVREEAQKLDDLIPDAPTM